MRVAAVPGRDGAGYLLIEVGRSERRPHRCEFGEKQYFKRVGDSSIAMEHYDIEDSFKRMTIPKLTAHFKLQEGGSAGGGAEGPYKVLIIRILLENDLLVTASHPKGGG